MVRVRARVRVSAAPALVGGRLVVEHAALLVRARVKVRVRV